jgi:hypothetical protein
MQEFPGILFARTRHFPSRHAGHANAVLDDVEQLAIGHLLSRAAPHVGRLGIHLFAELGVAAAIVAMACGAMVGPMFSRFDDDLR